MQENQSQIQYIKHHQIDFEKWDNCITNSCNELIYAHSFFLNIVSPNWDALVLNDYEIVMPLTRKSKWGINYLFQPIFSQQLGLFAINNNLIKTYQNSFIKEIQKHYKFVEIQLNVNNENNNLELTNNYELILNQEFDKIFQRFSQNHKRNIKKAIKENYKVVSSQDYKLIIDFFIKIKKNELKNNLYTFKTFLVNICKVLHQKNLIQSRIIYSNNNIIIAAGIFIHFKNRIIFICGTVSDEGRKNGAFHYLLAKHIEEYSNQNLIFDFEGSVNPSLGKFYESFGSYNNPYPKLKINNLPWFLKLFKK